jgi:hypothetical protein
VARPGVLCGRTCHIISKFLAGSMLELVGNPQEYVYVTTHRGNGKLPGIFVNYRDFKLFLQLSLGNQQFLVNLVQITGNSLILVRPIHPIPGTTNSWEFATILGIEH